MTRPEAAQLVIQAGSMGQGGDVFVLDMGEPVKIAELAEKMIQLSGLSVRSPDNADGDVEIRYTGLRPGEKLYEELLIGDRSEEHTSELQSLMRISYAVFCLKKKHTQILKHTTTTTSYHAYKHL